jgi:hypothetical protein
VSWQLEELSSYSSGSLALRKRVAALVNALNHLL